MNEWWLLLLLVLVTWLWVICCAAIVTRFDKLWQSHLLVPHWMCDLLITDDFAIPLVMSPHLTTIQTKSDTVDMWESSVSFMTWLLFHQGWLGILLPRSCIQGKRKKKKKKTTKYPLSKKCKEWPKTRLFNLVRWKLLSFYFNLFAWQSIQGKSKNSSKKHPKCKDLFRFTIWNNLDTVPPQITWYPRPIGF